jgi:autotransporter-associated beta strand protein
VDLGGGTRTITLVASATFNGVISNGGLNIIANPTSRVLTLGGNSTYSGPTNLNAGTLIINGDNSAATGAITVAENATLGGNGSSGGAVVMAPSAVLSARITDWTGPAGTGHEDLSAASLDAGGGALKLVVNTSGLVNFTETNKSFPILNTGAGITGFDTEQVTITTTATPAFTGAGTWSLVQSGTSLMLNYTAVTDSFQSWIGPFNVADETPAGDPDNDGSSNLMEFVLNGHPGISDTRILPDMDLSMMNFTFSFLRRDDSLGVPQVVQYGSDLSGWTDVNIPIAAGTTTVGAATVTVGEPASGTQAVTVRIPPGAPAVGKLLGRLKVGP